MLSVHRSFLDVLWITQLYFAYLRQAHLQLIHNFFIFLKIGNFAAISIGHVNKRMDNVLDFHFLQKYWSILQNTFRNATWVRVKFTLLDITKLYITSGWMMGATYDSESQGNFWPIYGQSDPPRSLLSRNSAACRRVSMLIVESRGENVTLLMDRQAPNSQPQTVRSFSVARN